MSETLTALKLIKLHAWERFFHGNARKVRQKEIRRIRSILLFKALTHAVAWSVGVVSAVACFAVIVFVTGKEVPLLASTVFTVLALLNTLRGIAVSGAKSSFERLDFFLRQAEIEDLADPIQLGGQNNNPAGGNINLGLLQQPLQQQQPGQIGPLRVALVGIEFTCDTIHLPRPLRVKAIDMSCLGYMSDRMMLI
ncbi:hypothetical protein BC937DRAFT_90332 [Endogone sp. FLAS-F59071]|nr:hypothetical protein BC937DRAFT_90332 [Endogone sp. FLAS-F59071]|eukprot:RUS17153.1 hypothetical protein BC937DRAFT_90332 [Endogone sp. FLAS-F59071]